MKREPMLGTYTHARIDYTRVRVRRPRSCTSSTAWDRPLRSADHRSPPNGTTLALVRYVVVGSRSDKPERI